MKQLLPISLSLLIAILLLPGCKKDKETETPTGATATLVLAANGGFINDDVELFVDGRSVYHQRVTTKTHGFAGGTQLTKNYGNHTIKAVINGNLVKSAAFTMAANKYIGINYNRATEVLIILRDNPFTYE